MKNVLILFQFLCPMYFYAADDSQAVSIKKIEVYVDYTKSIHLKGILKTSTFKLVQNHYSVPNKAGNYWFKIKIKSNDTMSKSFHLLLSKYAHMDIRCYYYLKDSLIVQKGGLIPHKAISHKNSVPNFDVFITGNGEVEVYVNYVAYGSAGLCDFQVMTDYTYNQAQQDQQFTYGFFYGILILIFIINLFYYFSLKQKVFLFYSVYILLTIFFCSYMDGIPLLGLFNFVGSYHRLWLFTSIVIYIGFFPLMTVYYLQLENNIKLLRLSYIYFIFTVLSAISLFIWDNDSFLGISYLYHNITVLIGLVFLIVLIVKGLRTNKILGRAFLIAMLIMIIAIMIPATSTYGYTSIGFDLTKVGSLLEVVILSLALALYFRGIKKELTVKNVKFDTLSNDYKTKEDDFFNLENRFLSSQMNPHFTFNAMNSILHFMLENESEKAQNYLTKYSRLIRKVLENNMNKHVSIKDEVDMLKLYLDMEKTRLTMKFEYEIILSPEINENKYFIPSMLIQPFIENAIWHGISHKEDGIGMILLFFSVEDACIKCVIEDNGIGREKSKEFKLNPKEHQSFGISITQQRLEHLKNKEDLNIKPAVFDLKDENNKPLGTRVEVYIPFQND